MTSFKFSRRVSNLYQHSVRETALLTPPGTLNLAGGSPALGLMPVDRLRESCNDVFSTLGANAFRYGNIQGVKDLVAWIARRHGVDESNVIVTTGSQQSIDIISKLMIDHGTEVAVENPTYVGARQVFDFFGATLFPITDISSPPQTSLCYVEPSFQNPTGRCWTLEQRKLFLSRFPGLIVEDDPFGDIYFGETRPVTLRELDPSRVIYLGSMSKILNPGIRLAYIIAPDELIEKLLCLKSAADMSSSVFVQEIVSHFLKNNDVNSYLDRIRTIYRQRSSLLYDSLAELPNLKVQPSQGGLFLWATADRDMKKLHDRSLEIGFNYMPGGDFFIESPDWSTIRLNYARISNHEHAQEVTKKFNQLFA